ncbi:MAG: hypothetical protein U0625_08570 [Phycisphaerales bacterium]
MHPGPDPVDPEQTVQRVALLYAMEDEAMPLVQRLLLQEQPAIDPRLPKRHFAARVGGVTVDLLINGKDPRNGSDRIGTEAATLAAYLAVRHFDPDLVVNAGTCGGFEARGSRVGDIYVAEGSILFHDRHIPIPEFALQARGAWPTLRAPGIAQVLRAKRGVLSTGNSLTFTPQEAEFFETEGVVLKEMEACAIAQVCGQLGVPFVAIKGVTDLVDHPEPVQEAFARNLRTVSALLAERVETLVRWLGAHPRRLAEL